MGYLAPRLTEPSNSVNRRDWEPRVEPDVTVTVGVGKPIRPKALILIRMTEAVGLAGVAWGSGSARGGWYRCGHGRGKLRKLSVEACPISAEWRRDRWRWRR